jgi:NAD-dependent dihydropyrimidine dehydrogenase PreA subunit
MSDVYRRLAKKLDSLPQGFPATAEGIEIRILKKIFKPEDAEMAARLKPFPESAGRIASRVGLQVDEMREVLDRMAARGQIGSFKVHGKRRYCMVPYVVGIYEFQLPHMDRELAELCEAYAPHLAQTLGGTGPALARVVPINKRLESQATVLAADDTRALMENARSFRVMNCICRTEQGLLENPCSHTKEVCLAFSREEDAWEGGNQLDGRTITREEAYEILDKAEEEGLVQCTYNFQHNSMFVCNCCSCCCGFMRLLTEYHTPYGLVRSNWEAVIDADSCEGCGVCANERCPVDAIEETDDLVYEVLSERCIGCGVCVLTCPTEAIGLEPRPEDDQIVPPSNIVDWSVERAANRSGPLKAMALRGWLGWHKMRHGGKGSGIPS